MSAAQKTDDRSQTETMPERDAPPVSLTQEQVERIMQRALEKQAKAAPVPVEAPLLTKKQWTAAASIVTLLFGSFGGGSYLGVAQLTDAEVTAQDDANRLIVREELKAATADVDKRVSAERAEFKGQIVEIKKDMADTRESVGKIESYILILKDRESRK